MTSRTNESSQEKTKNSGKASILNLYEEKLFYTKGQPLWMNWLETKADKSLKPKEEEKIRISNPLPKQVDQTNNNTDFKVTKFRDIRCCGCSCIGNVGLVEKTEEILDILRSCSYTCGANLLNSLPYIKKKKQNSATKANYRTELELKTSLQCKDPVQRPRYLSYFEVPAGENPFLNHKTVVSSQDPKGITRSQSLAASPTESPPYSVEFDAKKASDTRLFASSFSLSDRCWSDDRPNEVASRTEDIRPRNPSLGILTVEKRNISNQLVYSYHRSLLAAGKMKHQAGKKPVRVHLLTGESILLVFDPKACVKEVFEQICAMHAIKEPHFFGLSAIVENEHRFMDLKQKLSKYAPKEWGKEIRRRGSDMSIQPSSIFTVQFQVQYFVEHPKLICNMESRHHYYLQLKRNVLQSKVPVQDEVIFTLAAAALHVDTGPFDPSQHKEKYFDPHDYVPAWFLKKWDENYLWLHLPALHKELLTTSPFQALADYIKQASTIDDVPVHYYRLFKNKKETDPSVVMGIFHQGVRIHHVAPQRLDGPHLLDFEFPWSKVGRLFFAGKRFEIYPEDLPSSRKLVYFTGSRSRSKYLLRLLRDTHSLYMSLSPFVDHMRKVDGKNDRRKYRESYISGMNLDEKMTSIDERLVGSLDKNFDLHCKQNGGHCLFPYQSSLSNGSSRTSGIGSDVKHRSDDVIEGEDDDAFEEDNATAKVLKPSSGNSSMTKNQHSVALCSHTSAEKVAEKTCKETLSDADKDDNEDQGVSIEDASPREEVAAPATLSLESETSLKEQEEILLSTHTMMSKTATLRKNSCSSVTQTVTDLTPANLPSLSASCDSAKTLEDTIASILYDSNLQPPSPLNEKPCTSCGVATSLPVEQKKKSVDTMAKTNGSVQKKDHKHKKHLPKAVLDASVVHRSHSNDSSMQDSGVKPRSKKADSLRHRRNKSVHDADSSKDEPPSGKHFGATLTQKKSVEDLTAALQPPLNKTERHLDIAKAVGLDKKALTPQVESAPCISNHMSSYFDKGPIIAVNWSKYNGTGANTDNYRQKSNGFKTSSNKENRNERRRSDVPSLIGFEPKRNGHKPGSAGFTPGKAEMLFHHGKNRCRPVSHHVYPEIDTSTVPDSNTFHEAIPSSIHTPVFIDNFKEVIV